MTQSAYSNKPLPRLKHIQPGQFFTLRHDPEVRVLLHKTSTHGHFITDMHPCAMSLITAVWSGVRTDGKQEHELQLH